MRTLVIRKYLAPASNGFDQHLAFYFLDLPELTMTTLSLLQQLLKSSAFTKMKKIPQSQNELDDLGRHPSKEWRSNRRLRRCGAFKFLESENTPFEISSTTHSKNIMTWNVISFPSGVYEQDILKHKGAPLH